MAFVTYVLFVALLRGLQDRFHPEVLGAAASKALAVMIVDFIFVRTGCYILNIQGSGQVLDLIAYGGYKFVGLVLWVQRLAIFDHFFRVIPTLTAGLIGFGTTLYALIFLYFFFANAFFLVSEFYFRPPPRFLTAGNSYDHCGQWFFRTTLRPTSGP